MQMVVIDGGSCYQFESDQLCHKSDDLAVEPNRESPGAPQPFLLLLPAFASISTLLSPLKIPCPFLMHLLFLFDLSVLATCHEEDEDVENRASHPSTAHHDD